MSEPTTSPEPAPAEPESTASPEQAPAEPESTVSPEQAPAEPEALEQAVGVVAEPVGQAEEEDPGDGKLHHVNVEYCPRCRVPIGYCRFFGHDREAEAAAAEAAAAAAENGEAAPEPEMKPVVKQKRRPDIGITVKQRSRKKNTTTIKNMGEWGIDVKEFSKLVRTKNAIGCSTKKTKAGQVAVVIQGDASKMVIDALKTQYNVPAENISKTVQLLKRNKPKVIAVQPQPGPSPDQVEAATPWQIASRDYSDDDDA